MTAEHSDHLVAIVDDIAFGESVRWRHDRVWYCDWIDGTVVSVSPDGLDRTVHHTLDGFPICIDWDLEDRLLIVDGARRCVLRQHGEGLEVLADLSAISDAPWNEIATHPSGRAFVNGIGYDLMAGDAATTGQIAVIDTDGTIRQVADNLAFPNGMAIIQGGSRLVVAESHAGRITSFAIAPNGDLHDRATLVEVPGSAPDGLCVAIDGTIWYADVPNRHCRRITLGGAIVETIDADRGCFSCAVSPDGTLFITANVWDDETFVSRRGVLLQMGATGDGLPPIANRDASNSTRSHRRSH